MSLKYNGVDASRWLQFDHKGLSPDEKLAIGVTHWEIDEERSNWFKNDGLYCSFKLVSKHDRADRPEQSVLEGCDYAGRPSRKYATQHRAVALRNAVLAAAAPSMIIILEAVYEMMLDHQHHPDAQYLAMEIDAFFELLEDKYEWLLEAKRRKP
jgi:hypothetical protein